MNERPIIMRDWEVRAMTDREILPCPFCGAGKTEIREDRPWIGMRYGEPSSVSVRHWCEPIEGQPSRMIERVGRDRAAAIAAWNMRTTAQENKQWTPTQAYVHAAIGNWMRSGDTGISSETMAAIALGADSGDFDAPYDPSDFGRCYRLVQAIPAIRDAFPRIAELVPAFAGILREWDALVAIYLRDLPSGKSDELYQRIKTLRAMSNSAVEGEQ